MNHLEITLINCTNWKIQENYPWNMLGCPKDVFRYLHAPTLSGNIYTNMKPNVSNVVENQRKHFRDKNATLFKKKATALKIPQPQRWDLYGNGVANVQTVRSWFKKFKTGNFNLEDKEHSGRPSTTDTALIKAMVDENPWYNVLELADIWSIPRTTMYNNLTKIGYVNRFEVWVPCQLTEN